MTVDGKATYYCTSTLELVVHDSTHLLNDPADPKQLKRKRHIGNDHVHIIWNDSKTEYKWDTIGGDFGNAQIAITPLSNGLYKIDIYQDETVVPSFGILQNCSVVAKAALAPLVRYTAINAYRSVIANGGQQAAATQPHPYEIRKEMIELISNRHGGGYKSFEAFMIELLTTGVKEAKQDTPAIEVVPASDKQ